MNILQKYAWYVFLPQKENLNVKLCGFESKELFGNAMKDIGYQFSENNEEHVDVIFYILNEENTLSKIFYELSELTSNSLFFLISKVGEYGQLKRLSQDLQHILMLTNLTIEDEALYDERLEWATSIPRTGKLDYFKWKINRREIPLFNCKEKKQLTIFSGKEVNSWIHNILFDFNKKRLLQSPVEIGRIDKMRTGNSIIQIKDEGGAKYGIKIFDKSPNQNEEYPKPGILWLDKLSYNDHVPQTIKKCLPQVVYASKFNGMQYQLEKWLLGKPASLYFYNKTLREKIIDHAIDWSTEFQIATQSLNSSFELELNNLSRILGFFASKGMGSDSITVKITEYISNKLTEYNCPVVCCHGDFWVGNLLVDDNFIISGVVDWDFAEDKTVPLIDIFHVLFHRKTIFSFFRPWKNVEKSLAGKLSYQDQVKIKNSMKKIGINPQLFSCLLIVYCLKYLYRDYDFMHKISGWNNSAIKIYELLYAQTSEDWDKLSNRMMGL